MQRCPLQENYSDKATVPSNASLHAKPNLQQKSSVKQDRRKPFQTEIIQSEEQQQPYLIEDKDSTQGVGDERRAQTELLNQKGQQSKKGKTVCVWSSVATQTDSAFLEERCSSPITERYSDRLCSDTSFAIIRFNARYNLSETIALIEGRVDFLSFQQLLAAREKAIEKVQPSQDFQKALEEAESIGLLAQTLTKKFEEYATALSDTIAVPTNKPEECWQSTQTEPNYEVEWYLHKYTETLRELQTLKTSVGKLMYERDQLQRCFR